ncbi:hypothetical protein [Paraburkholderia ferrariae]|uniref:hypothetical protein n=1 Tax=Paraburkholderia ferrariae TaxID=386056 RepID=UPI000486164A|nr:hypothetical protein [Paraburkholderia ferrariae]
MIKSPRAAIVFYDEDSQEFKICNVLRSKVQALIDNATVMPVPLEEHDAAITDEDARRLGGMVMLMQGHTNTGLRERFKITIERPMKWESPQRPEQE